MAERLPKVVDITKRLRKVSPNFGEHLIYDGTASPDFPVERVVEAPGFNEAIGKFGVVSLVKFLETKDVLIQHVGGTNKWILRAAVGLAATTVVVGGVFLLRNHFIHKEKEEKI